MTSIWLISSPRKIWSSFCRGFSKRRDREGDRKREKEKERERGG